MILDWNIGLLKWCKCLVIKYIVINIETETLNKDNSKHLIYKNYTHSLSQ